MLSLPEHRVASEQDSEFNFLTAAEYGAAH